MYWDLTVFLNFLVDYLLLFAAARLSGTYAVHWRLLAAATLGCFRALNSWGRCPGALSSWR